MEKFYENTLYITKKNNEDLILLPKNNNQKILNSSYMVNRIRRTS